MPRRRAPWRVRGFGLAARHASDLRVTRLTSWCVLVGLLASVAHATNLAPPVTLTHPTAYPGARFGCAAATDGTRFLIGACLDDTGGQDVGSAFLFDAAGTVVRTLRARPALAGMQLGFAVAIVGADPVVGTPHYPNGFPHSGVVLVFDTDQGTGVYDPSPQQGGYFGTAVAGSGTDLVIGAPYRDGSAGGAALYSHSGTLLRTFVNPDPTGLNATNSDRFDAFGKVVAADAAYAVVAAPFEPTDKKSAGAVYVYDVATGALRTTLRSPHPIANDHFGAAVAINGPYVLVGAPDDDFDTPAGGMAYLFDAAVGGAPVVTLANPRHTADAAFGSAVGFLNGAFVVGAPRQDEGATDAGSVYVFDPIDPTTVVTVDNPAPAANDKFGEVLAARGAGLVVTAAFHSVNGSAGSGAAYVYVDLGGVATTTTTAPGTSSTTTSTTKTTTTSTSTSSTTVTSSTASSGASTSTTTATTAAPGSSATTTAATTPTTAVLPTETTNSSTTSTTDPECTVDDECKPPPDTCTSVRCDAGACVYTPTAVGLDAVACSLDALTAAIAEASLSDLGGTRTATRLQRQPTVAAAAVRAAAQQKGRRRLRRLRRAERALERFLRLVRTADSEARVAPVLSSRLLLLGADVVQRLAYARVTP